jgi:hypothetical protein
VQGRVEIGFDVSQVRLILVTLICSSPVILLLKGLIMQGVIAGAGAVAVALAIMARTLRSGETEFLIFIIRPWALIAAVPALWVLIQILPIKSLAHRIWKSAETALGHPVVAACCLLTFMLLSIDNAGPLGMATSLIAAVWGCTE